MSHSWMSYVQMHIFHLHSTWLSNMLLTLVGIKTFYNQEELNLGNS
jgi:hypothetical protein